MGLAGGDLALQAGGQELLVRPALRAGPFGQPVTDWRSVGALSARVRNASSAVRSRAGLLAVVAIRPPLGVVEAEGGVVVGQAAQLDLALVAAGDGGPLGAQPGRGAAAWPPRRGRNR